MPTDRALRLLDLLDLETLEDGHCLGRTPAVGRVGRLFGGQIAAQALVAAARSVDEGTVHSLHAYFLAGGDPREPIRYEAHRIRDGRSYSVRRVEATQGETTILVLTASFHRGADESGFEHQADRADEAPDPEDVPSYEERLASWGFEVPPFAPFRLLDFRPIEFVDPRDPQALPPSRRVWFRAPERLPDDWLLHAGVTTYASDIFLLATALLPHAIPSTSSDVAFASVDHAVWFHRPHRADDWLLHEQRTPSASSGRGMATGSIYTRDGRLVASVAQEGVLRRIKA